MVFFSLFIYFMYHTCLIKWLKLGITLSHILYKIDEPLRLHIFTYEMIQRVSFYQPLFN